MYAVVLAFLITAGWNANHFASVLVLLQEHQSLSSVLVTGAYGIYALGLFPSLLVGGYVAAVIGFSAALTVQAVGRRQGWGPGTGVVGAVCAAIGMALVGVGYGLCLREGLLDVNTFSPPASRGRVIGFHYVATYIGFGLPPLIAWLTPRIGAVAPFAVVSVLAVASAAIRARQIRSGYLARG